MLDEDVRREGVHQELTELGMRVMRKFAGLDAEKKYVRKKLTVVCRNFGEVGRRARSCKGCTGFCKRRCVKMFFFYFVKKYIV